MAIVFRTVNDQPTLWDAILPVESLVMSSELTRVDALLDDPVFFAPFAPFFDPCQGRPSIPMETYLRLMFLKFRYRATPKVRADDITVVGADVAYPTDSGLPAKAVGQIARTVNRVKAAGGATRTRCRDRRCCAGRRVRAIAGKLKLRGAQQRDEAQTAIGEAAAVLGNGRACCRALDDLDTIIERADRVIAQTCSRRGRPRSSRPSPCAGDRGGRPARTAPRLDGAVRADLLPDHHSARSAECLLGT